MTSASSRALSVADIADARAYDRERAQHRPRMIELRARRRVAVGTIISLAFENRDTIRFQIQEMARAERIVTDEGIEEELAAYNPLIPEPGQLKATLFIELTSDEQMREWLPKLVGIESHVLFVLPGGGEVRCTVDAGHATHLTREHTTAAVHYIGFDFTAEEVAGFVDGTVLAIDHPAYREQTVLGPAVRADLAADLAPDLAADLAGREFPTNP
jgi:hypothetical protein